jgi:hypothetical protein
LRPSRGINPTEVGIVQVEIRLGALWIIRRTGAVEHMRVCWE